MHVCSVSIMFYIIVYHDIFTCVFTIQVSYYDSILHASTVLYLNSSINYHINDRKTLQTTLKSANCLEF